MPPVVFNSNTVAIIVSGIATTGAVLVAIIQNRRAASDIKPQNGKTTGETLHAVYETVARIESEIAEERTDLASVAVALGRHLSHQPQKWDGIEKGAQK
jgi:hypothetical protein